MSNDTSGAVASNDGLGPVAWKFMQAAYGEGDVRGRGWLPALKFTRPMWEVMQKDVQPLFTRAQLDAEVAAERERWQRIATNAQAVTTGSEDKLDYFEVPSHLMAALALALDEGPNTQSGDTAATQERGQL